MEGRPELCVGQATFGRGENSAPLEGGEVVFGRPLCEQRVRLYVPAKHGAAAACS